MFRFLVLLCFLTLLSYCKNEPKALVHVVEDTIGDTSVIVSKFCGSCHLLPAPTLLDKKTWAEFVLPNMGCRLGLETENYNPIGGLNMMEQTLIHDREIYPDSSKITRNDWLKVLGYYSTYAPDSLPVSSDKNRSLTQFEIVPLGSLIKYPIVTMLSVDSLKHEVKIGLESGVIFTLDQSFHLIDTINIKSTPLGISTDENRNQYILSVGRMYPSEQSFGSIFQLGSHHSLTKIIEGLHRPVFLSFDQMAGFNNLIISEFGYETGGLTRFQYNNKSWQKAENLDSQPGSVKTLIADLDNDHVNEIIALMAQGQERVVLYKPDSSGHLTSKTLLRFPPVYGLCDMDIADMNGDGKPDIILSNGDNADYSKIIKPYHGIRIYLNKGDLIFEESNFIPYPGVLHSEIADFDGDGDMDIAATSFFPGDESHPYKSFKYFQNNDGKYEPYSFSNANYGKWMTIASGDFDGDGDLDILLGSFLLNQYLVEGNVADWSKYALVLLKNKLRK